MSSCRNITRFVCYGNQIGTRHQVLATSLGIVFSAAAVKTKCTSFRNFDTHCVAFTSNHSNPHVHLFQSSRLYKLANAYMLAWPYGFTRVMSSYDFFDGDHVRLCTISCAFIYSIQNFILNHRQFFKSSLLALIINFLQGPPAHADGTIKDVTINPDGTCGDGWICEHRWRQITNMVEFRYMFKFNIQQTTVNRSGTSLHTSLQCKGRMVFWISLQVTFGICNSGYQLFLPFYFVNTEMSLMVQLLSTGGIMETTKLHGPVETRASSRSTTTTTILTSTITM